MRPMGSNGTLSEWLHVYITGGYLGPRESSTYLGISIASAVFTELTRWQTDRQTTLRGQ